MRGAASGEDEGSSQWGLGEREGEEGVGARGAASMGWVGEGCTQWGMGKGSTQWGRGMDGCEPSKGDWIRIRVSRGVRVCEVEGEGEAEPAGQGGCGGELFWQTENLRQGGGAFMSSRKQRVGLKCRTTQSLNTQLENIYFRVLRTATQLGLLRVPRGSPSVL